MISNNRDEFAIMRELHLQQFEWHPAGLHMKFAFAVSVNLHTGKQYLMQQCMY